MLRKIIAKLHNPESRYSVGRILRWLWRELGVNRRQAVLNALIGLLGVVLSLLMVWAMQRAIDVASGARPGSLYWAVGLMGLLIIGELP